MLSYFIFAAGTWWLVAQSSDVSCGGKYYSFHHHNETTYDANCACNVTYSWTTCHLHQSPAPVVPPPGENVSIVIQCDDEGPSDFSSVLRTALDISLTRLFLSRCRLPATFGGMLAGFARAATVLSYIYIEHPRGELRREHVLGLRAVEEIVMDHASDQTRIPFNAMNDLPTLEHFYLHDAKLQLEPVGGDDVSPHPALRSVILERCGITDVPSGAFRRLGNITVLHLSWNLIKYLTKESFKGLTNLQTLILTGNPLTALPSHAFEFCPRLRYVWLDEMSLTAVPGDAFKGLKYLERVSINNGKNTVQLSPGAFASLESLRELRLRSTPLRDLPENLLENSTDLRVVYISDAGLQKIPRKLFRSQQHLIILNLSGNKIKTLDPEVFEHMKELHDLYLESNSIEKLPSSLFSVLPMLNKMYANNNSLKYIEYTGMKFESPLETLDLSKNHLILNDCRTTYSSFDVFDLMPHLGVLKLRGNNISCVHPAWKRLQNLRTLDLSSNNFTKLTRADINFRSRAVEIDFSYNHITSISIASDNSANKTLNDRMDPQNDIPRLILYHNPVRCDCELYTFVKEIKKPKYDSEYIKTGHVVCVSPPKLAGTKIRELQTSLLTCSLPTQDCPANCTCTVHSAAQYLHLDCATEPSKYPDPKNYNQQKIILRLRNTPTLKLPPHVISLNLTGLNLKEPPFLQLIEDIQELDLSRNSLINAPTELFKANISLRLEGNNFACDCSHLEDVHSLQKNAARILDNVTCKGGKSVNKIDIDMLCEVRKASLLGGALAAAGLLTAFAAAFAYRYSLEIKVYLFSRGWCQSWFQEDDLDDGAQYDAFVSFSQDDAQWVAEQLLPKLEGEPNNFKLCVHFRDWVVGEMIPAQIATSVEQSRRTIIVLSQSFLTSMWASLEFRAANARAHRERRARVLVVVLGDVPDGEDMDAELRAYLTTNTYLQWGDPWFWEKLRYAMPHRRQNAAQ